jgi:hypothetical protein
MQRHELAIVQMWDGLVLPSENAWRSGTVTITRAPLRAPELAGRPISPALHERIEATRGLAKQARLATTYQERGRVYGELIAGCAQCHSLQRPASNQPRGSRKQQMSQRRGQVVEAVVHRAQCMVMAVRCSLTR